MKTYYRVTESNPQDWTDTDTIIKLGGVHFSTIVSNRGAYRHFVMHLSDEELLLAKLSVGRVSFDVLSKTDYAYLTQSGYIK